MKRVISLFTAAIMAATLLYIPAGVYAEDGYERDVLDAGKLVYEEGPKGSGFINIEGLTIKLKDPVDAETTSQKLRLYGSSALINNDIFDPRESYEAVIKDQGSTGLCWAFSMTTAAERDYYNEANKMIELSPGHLGFFFYNRVNDPLGNTAGDRNVNVSEYNWMKIGGNQFLGAQALAGWGGFAEENIAIFDDKNVEGYADEIAYENSVILENAEFIDEVSEVKAAIIENGAVVMAYHAPVDNEEELYFNKDTFGYYCDDTEQGSNHAGTIVGWDDKFSADNFVTRPVDANGQAINGAWIVQNSWGESYGEKGYFYLSYADATTCNYTSLDVQSADTYDYNYQYDGNAYPGIIPMSNGEKAANVFLVANEERQLLEAVNFTVWSGEIAEYTIDIYTDISDAKKPLSGTKECSFDVSTNNAGIYTFRLKDYGVDSVYLEPGTRYSIVITTKSDTEIGVEASYIDATFKFVAENDIGESFLYAPNIGWYDCYESDYSVRIKGLVSIADENIVPEDISISGIEDNGSISIPYGTTKAINVDFTPSNAMQRSIKWTSSAPNIAQVDANGKLKSYSVGTAVITAETVNGIKKSFTVKVTVPDLSAVSSLAVNLYGHDDYIASWPKVAGATGYYVYYKKSSWSSWKSLGTTTTTYKKVANLADGAKYAFRVYPYIKIGNTVYKDSSYKTSSYVYSLKKVSKPKIKKASKKYIKISWTNIPGETGYQIARSKKKNSGYTNVKNVNYKYKTIKLKVPRKKTYYYKIRAYKTVNGKKIYGPWSSVRSYKLR